MLKSSILTSLELLSKGKQASSKSSSNSSSTPKSPRESLMTSRVSTSNTATPSDESSADSAEFSGVISSLRKDELFRLMNGYYDQRDSNTDAVTAPTSSHKRTTSPTPVIKPADQVKTGNLIMMTDSGKRGASSDGLVYNPRTGQSEVSGKNALIAATIDPAQGIPPAFAELAGIVAELPSDFDLSGWDDKTAKEQQIALQHHSGLSSEDQMTLLNSATSLETIATVQDIQANRVLYGLTQAKADYISKELFEITNTRIGVKIRALPFSTDSQRNLFLKQLDEKEQDLLGFLEPQLGNTADSWYDDEDSTQIESKTEQPLFVRSVDNGSDLANTAKDILKSYLKFCFINRISNTLLVSELLGTAIDRGTISIGFSKSAILLIGASKNIGLVMDTSGNVGVIKTVGVFGGIPSASVVAFASISSAPDIRKLEGKAFESGASVGQGLCAGGEVCIFTDEETGEIYAAVNLLAGIGASADSFEFHAGLTETEPIEYVFNLYDEWQNFLQEFQEW
jgi:hypothetical protein